MTAEHRINDRIRAPQVRVIGPDGAQLGILRSEDALAQARELDLDLVEVASSSDPPVCKIMDYGKFRYEQSIKAKEARRRRTADEVKEMKFRPKIGPHDFDTKKRHVEHFLNAGHRVKVTLMFRGREMAHTELGLKVLQQLEKDLEAVAVAENRPKLDGRNMTMMFAPSKKKPAGGSAGETGPSARRPNTKADGAGVPKADDAAPSGSKE